MNSIRRAGKKSRKLKTRVPEKGRSQPPRKSVVAMAETTIMLVYSARK